MSEAAGGPRFDPATALGWHDVGLDGLSCFLRCVEAVLAHHGRSPREIAASLATPLDLTRSDPGRGPFGDFPGCRLEWRTVPGGIGWDELATLLRRHRYPVLSPNGLHWPGDEFNGVGPAHHHMVLAVRLDDGGLEVLDTDAPPDDGFRRPLPLTDSLRRAFDRVAVVEPRPVPRDDDPVATAERLLGGGTRRLAADLSELAGFRALWLRQPLPETLARGLHVFVLGDVQPQLFTLARALDFLAAPGLGPVVGALETAAHRAKKLGIMLTGLHRFRSRQVYTLCLEEFESLEGALHSVLAALSAHAGETVPRTPPAEPRRLAARLAEVTEWSFGLPPEDTLRWFTTPSAA
ncbi:hypothetical protein [Streptomyces naphthomycinicus]|uniref:hypothetical protein n=1 Tax=Streptomyces naphthomycinicus TaxID=2872625 RepID=UPI001CED4F99|nr:hypothetical protein [Streptomyces sp. TML10]